MLLSTYRNFILLLLFISTTLGVYAQKEDNLEEMLKADTVKYNYGGTNMLNLDLDLGKKDTIANKKQLKGKKLMPVSDKINNTPLKQTHSSIQQVEKASAPNPSANIEKKVSNTNSINNPTTQSIPIAKTRTIPNVYVPASVQDHIPQNKLIGKPFVEPRKGEDIYRTRLAAIPSLIPLDYNEMVKGFINMYTKDKRDQVSRMLSRTDDYFVIFEQTLDRYGLPMELKYLPIIESALIAHAKSETGESGLWQLPYKIARQHGLETNDFIDERRDPQLSTEAAVQELSKLYRQYGNWHWVIAAYNCGEGVANKAIQLSGNRLNYWDAATFLPAEAQAYVPLFIAAVYIMQYHEQHDIQKFNAPYIFYATDTVRIKKGINLKKVAANIDMNINELVYLNPAVIKDSIPPSQRGYPINIPISKLGAFTAYINNIDPVKAVIIDGTQEKTGDLPENNIWNDERDEFGNLIKQKTNATNEKDKPLRNVMQGYKVREGDALSTIAKKFDCTIEEIKRWNRLKSDKVTANEIIFIYVTEQEAGLSTENTNIDKTTADSNSSQKTATKPNTTKPKEYKVKEGDTIWSIAQKFGVEAEQLKKYNAIKNNKPLAVGAIVKIPTKK